MAKLSSLHNSATFDFEVTFCVTAFSIVLSALFGSSSVTVFTASAMGIQNLGVLTTSFELKVAGVLFLQRVEGRD